MGKQNFPGVLKHERFALVDNSPSINQRLRNLHDRLRRTVPTVERIACALYDPGSDMLKTFVNSTLHGEPIAGYEFRLAESVSLSHLARTAEYRLIADIPAVLNPDSPHTSWIIQQGYRTSFTVPIYDNNAFAGMIFFNSRQADAFTARMQVDLGLCAALISMMVSGELAAVRALSASAHIAREFANLRDFETGAHLERMARYARLIAKSVAGIYDLNDEFIEHVYLFAPLHDIGKIGVPDRVLLKPGPLDSEERQVMEEHVVKGHRMVANMLADFGLQSLPDAAIMRNLVVSHHEFLDGSGYPNHLRGDAVPVEARIVTVADIFDALTSVRPYKTAWSVERACEELERMARAGKLDLPCVQAIGAHAAEFATITERFRDAA